MSKRKGGQPGPDSSAAWDGQTGDSNPDVATVGVVVRFVKRDAPFNQGDVRAFPAAEAAKFIRQGVAEEVIGG